MGAPADAGSLGVGPPCWGSGEGIAGTEGHHGDRGTFSPVLFMPPGLAFPSATVCLSFPFPSVRALWLPSGTVGCRISLGGVRPALVTPTASVDVADVPWEGDTLQHPVFCTSPGRSSQECPSRAGQVLLQGEGWAQAGPPSWVLAHRLPCPGLAPAPAGGGGLVLRLDRKTNEFHYGIAILFHVSGSLRLTCSPGCDKPRHPRARARVQGLRMLAGHGAA